MRYANHVEIVLEFVTVNSSGVRRESMNGRDYLVVGATLIRPGVLNGSRGRLYYPPEEVVRNVDGWNGMPLTWRHPKIGGQHVSARHPSVLGQFHVGWVFNATDKRGLLSAEAWIDEERALAFDQDLPAHLKVVPRLLAGRPVELSTGLFTDNSLAVMGASHNGTPYDFVARNYRPDHLAILPDEVGACSLNDGCGLGVANTDLDADDRGLLQRIYGAVMNALGLTNNYIKRLDNGRYQVTSESGKNLGQYDTEEEARERLRQVEYFKHTSNSDEPFIEIDDDDEDGEVTDNNCGIGSDGFEPGNTCAKGGGGGGAGHSVKVPRNKRKLTIDQTREALGQMGYKLGDSKVDLKNKVTTYELTKPDGSSARVSTDEIKEIVTRGSKQAKVKAPKAPPAVKPSAAPRKKSQEDFNDEHPTVKLLSKGSRPEAHELDQLHSTLKKHTVPQLKELQKKFLGKSSNKGLKQDRIDSLVSFMKSKAAEVKKEGGGGARPGKVARGAGRLELEESSGFWKDLKTAFRDFMQSGSLLGGTRNAEGSDPITGDELHAAVLNLLADESSDGAELLVGLYEGAFLTSNSEGSDNVDKNQKVQYLTTNCDCWRGKEAVLNGFDDEHLTKLVGADKRARATANALKAPITLADGKKLTITVNSASDGQTVLTANEACPECGGAMKDGTCTECGYTSQKKEPTNPPPPTGNRGTPTVSKWKTTQDWLNDPTSAPEEVKAAVRNSIARDLEEKRSIVARLTANVVDETAREAQVRRLMSKSLDDLRADLQLVPTGNAVPGHLPAGVDANAPIYNAYGIPVGAPGQGQQIPSVFNPTGNGIVPGLIPNFFGAAGGPAGGFTANYSKAQIEADERDVLDYGQPLEVSANKDAVGARS